MTKAKYKKKNEQEKLHEEEPETKSSQIMEALASSDPYEYYNKKSTPELLWKFKYQTRIHTFCAISARDDVEANIVESILYDRGFGSIVR